MVSHYDVQHNMSKLVRLLDTCYQLNYQYPHRASISIAIDAIYDTLNQVNNDILACVDNVALVVENPKNNI